MTSTAFSIVFLPFRSTNAAKRDSLTTSRFTGIRLANSRSNAFAQRKLICPRHPFASPRQQPTCYTRSKDGEDGDDDDDDDADDEGEDENEDDDFDDEPDIMLWDEFKKKSLPVGVQYSITHKNVNYLVCYPINDPVAFAKMDDHGSLEPVHNQDMIEKLFPNASAVLSEEHLQLQDTPHVLTICDFGDGDLEEEDPDDDDDDEVEGDEQVEVIAEFSSDGQSYCVVKPMDPVLLVAKEIDTEESYAIVGDEELQRITPVIEDYIESLDI